MADVDYSLYLVTDSTMIPDSCTFLSQVRAAVENGATIVQLREKAISTLDFVEMAEKVHEITREFGVPLIINDRVDVALAVDAEGVHVGQDDMPAALVRKIIGPDKVLGISCGNYDEIDAACNEAVVDYVGLGTTFPTATKKVKNTGGIGPIGLRVSLQRLGKHNLSHKRIKCVAIGGINHENVSRVCFQAQVSLQRLDGVAVVSCIMAATDAALATSSLLRIIKLPAPWEASTTSIRQETDLSAKIVSLHRNKPLVHHITNNVVKNFSANVSLAIGASPAMSELAEEFPEFARNVEHVSLVANLGTPNAQLIEVMRAAFAAYNSAGKHIVFDPVAAGASKARLQATRQLLNAGQVSVMKGNVGEIMAVHKLTSSFDNGCKSDEALMRGVDSLAQLTEEQIIRIAQDVATDFRTVVVVTGEMNYIVNGEDQIEKVRGGHELMGTVTGTGCALGSVIAAFLGSGADGTSGPKCNVFECVVGAVRLYNESGMNAGAKSNAPSSFMVNFIDQLYFDTHRL